MEKLTINIDGVPTEITTKKVDIDKIYLDQENPRIGLFRDSQIKEDLSQDEIRFALINKNPEAFDKLRYSIEVNDGIINPIWLQPLNNEKYIIIEGNTRLVIYKELNDKYPHKEAYKKILSRVLPGRVTERQKDFIKLEAHLRGTTPWDSYEKARYLYLLNDREGYSVPVLQRLTRLSQNEIRLFIQAFLDMQDQYLPRFGDDPSEVFKFSYFVEYEKNTKLKEEMKRHNLTMSDFCNWVGSSRIPRAMLVRELQPLLESKETRETFISKGYDYALDKLSIIKPTLTSPLFENIEKVIEGLRNLPSWEIGEIREGEHFEKKRLINTLDVQVQKTKQLIDKG